MVKLTVRELTGFLLPSGMRRSAKVVIKAKCGEENPVWASTLPDRKGGENPEWSEEDDALMYVPRWGGDGGILVIGVYLFGKNGRDTFLGGNHLQLQKYMDNPNMEYEEEVRLYVGGTAEGGAGSGIVHLKIQWVPDRDASAPRHGQTPAGNIHVTADRAAGLKKPDKIIRDLSTYVDYTSAYVALVCFAVYLLAGFAFYQGFMAAPLELVVDELAETDLVVHERQKDLLEKIQGGNGDWDTINTLVFMVTSFTTVGYGNQPSMVATTPPCEYAGGPAVLDDAPFSVLLPDEIRGSKVGIGKIVGLNTDDEGEESNFSPLPARCFPRKVDPAVGIGGQEECRVIADERHIFDFTRRQLYARGELSPPRNFSTDLELSLLGMQPMPGDTGLYDCGDVNDANANETIAECYERFVGVCESSLKVWRNFELKKDYSKAFTVVFVMIGIGILGAVVGVFGETLMDWAKSLFAGAEATLDVAMTPATMATGIQIEDVTGGSGKGACVAFVGLGIVVGIGTAVYATLESMKVIDAVYFTVVTSTTLGFGDYCPETDGGKIFTLFFVPVSVVAVAGAIEHVASIPLNSRKEKLENYVLAQFGDDLKVNDLDDIRLSAGLRKDEDIKANDFLFAMMIRLGYINPDDTKSILALFAKLDTNQNGCISNADVGGTDAENGSSNGTYKAASKGKPKKKAQQRERDMFDEEVVEEEEEEEEEEEPPPPPPVAPRGGRGSKSGGKTDRTNNPVSKSNSKKGKTKTAPARGAPAAAPVKKSMALGERDGSGEKVKGADGKTRRKVKKAKKPDRSDEV